MNDERIVKSSRYNIPYSELIGSIINNETNVGSKWDENAKKNSLQNKNR